MFWVWFGEGFTAWWIVSCECCVWGHTHAKAGLRYPFFSLATVIHKRRGIPPEHMCRKGSLVLDKGRGLIVIPWAGFMCTVKSAGYFSLASKSSDHRGPWKCSRMTGGEASGKVCFALLLTMHYCNNCNTGQTSKVMVWGISVGVHGKGSTHFWLEGLI